MNNEDRKIKIREALIKFRKSAIDSDGIKGEDIVAWIEKQHTTNPEEMRDLLMEYSKGRYDTITKAVEWLYQRQAVDLDVPNIEKFIEDFRKSMED